MHRMALLVSYSLTRCYLRSDQTALHDEGVYPKFLILFASSCLFPSLQSKCYSTMSSHL